MQYNVGHQDCQGEIKRSEKGACSFKGARKNVEVQNSLYFEGPIQDLYFWLVLSLVGLYYYHLIFSILPHNFRYFFQIILERIMFLKYIHKTFFVVF